MKNNNRTIVKSTLFFAVVILFLGSALLISRLAITGSPSFLCSLPSFVDDYTPMSAQLHAVLHYATSSTTPQQSRAEIRVSFDVLKSRAPCNFLVFGLGHDSLMWSSFNPRGTTLFLEEDSTWVQKVLGASPELRAETVKYSTQLKQADELLSHLQERNRMLAVRSLRRGLTWQQSVQVVLALSNLPEVVYEKEWDLIMIDAPKGYFPEAPGRMAAIYSAAMMARRRKGSGVTHVFLHDVDRKVEKAYAEEFLCRKYLVNAVGRLWHFEIPAAGNDTGVTSFC